MTQYFDDIKISDKGMIKLIRHDGKDYIFPAHKINSVYTDVKEVHQNFTVRQPGIIESVSGLISEPRDGLETLGCLAHVGLMFFMPEYHESINAPNEVLLGYDNRLFIKMEKGEVMCIQCTGTAELIKRVKDAKHYSDRLFRNKYGVFS